MNSAGSKRVSIEFPMPLYNQLAEVAEAEHRTMSGLIRHHMAERVLAAKPAASTPAVELHMSTAPPPVVVLPDPLDKRIGIAADGIMDEWESGDPVYEGSADAVRQQVTALLEQGIVPVYISQGLRAWDGGDPGRIPVFVQAAESGESHE